MDNIDNKEKILIGFQIIKEIINSLMTYTELNVTNKKLEVAYSIIEEIKMIIDNNNDLNMYLNHYYSIKQSITSLIIINNTDYSDDEE